MKKTDIGGARGWLDAGPAASLKRIDKALGRRIDINSAGRTASEQAEMIKKFPKLAAAVGQSPHQRGVAIDTDDWGRSAVRSVLRDNGWSAPLKHEPWHWVYRRSRDCHANETAKQNPDANVAGDGDEMENGADDMIIYAKASDSAVVYAVNTATGAKRQLRPAEWKLVQAAFQASGQTVPYARNTIKSADMAKVG